MRDPIARGHVHLTGHTPADAAVVLAILALLIFAGLVQLARMSETAAALRACERTPASTYQGQGRRC